MAFGADSAASLLFKIVADTGSASKELKSFASSLTSDLMGSSKTAKTALNLLTTAIGENAAAAQKAAAEEIKAAEKIAAANKLIADSAKLRAVEAKIAGAENAGILEREAQALALNSQQSSLKLNVLKQEAKVAASALEEGAAGAGAGFTALLAPVAIATAAVAALAVAAAVTGKALFSLAESSAEFGAKLYDATIKTGLSAKTISALSYAADQSNVSLESVITSVNIFEKTLAKAAEGSKSASAILVRAGLDPKEAYKNLETSLESVFNNLSKLPDNSIKKLGTLKELFGRNGDSVAQLLDTIKKGGGTFDDFKKKLEEAGLTLSEKDLKASKEFQGALQALEYQAKILAANFATQYMPQITNALKSIGKFLEDNKATFTSWGKFVGDVIEGTASRFLKLQALIQFAQHPGDPGAYALLAGKVAEADYQKPPQTQTPETHLPVPEIDNEKAAAESEKAERAREKARQEQFAANEKFNSANKAAFEQGYAELSALNKSNYEKGLIDQQKYLSELQDNEINYLHKLVQLTQNDADIKKAQEKNKTARAAIDIETRTAIDKITEESNKRYTEGEKLVTETVKKTTETRVKLTELELQKKLELLRANSEKELAVIAQRNASEKQLESRRVAEEQKIKTDAIRDELELNKRVLQSGDLSPEKRAEVNQKNAILDVQLSTQKINAAVAVTEAINKETIAQDEASRRAAENLERIKLAILRTQNDIKAVRRDQDRANITNSLAGGSLTTKERLLALISLRDFDIQENERQRQSAITEANQEHDLELAKVKDKTKEFEQVNKINELLKERINLINAGAGAKKDQITEQSSLGVQQGKIDNAGDGFLGGILQGAGIGAETLNKKLDPLKTIGNIVGGQFNLIASAVGNAVQAFVLYGNAGVSVRKVTAQILASIAQQSAIQALYELAQGFAVLALALFGIPNAGPSATAHFTAAEQYGLVAGVSAVAGRAAAGNQFATGTGATGTGATGTGASGGVKSNTATGGGANSGSGTPGGYYSSQSDTRQIEENRLRFAPKPQTVNVNLNVKSNDSHIVNTVKQNIVSLGDLHSLVIRTVEGA